MRKYLDSGVAYAIVERFNATNCKPPLDRDELIRITVTIAKLETARREARDER